MPEKKKDPKETASIKVFADLLDALKDEQTAQRKRGNPEPTYAEILDTVWRDAQSAKRKRMSVRTPGIDVAPEESHLVYKFVQFLRHAKDPNVLVSGLESWWKDHEKELLG